MGLSRRAVLASAGAAAGLIALSGAGFVLVDHEVLPGRSVLNEGLGRCDPPAPDGAGWADPGPVLTGSFRSAARSREVGFAIAYPPGHGVGSPLPVCLALHGFGGRGQDAVNTGRFSAYLAGAVRAGTAPFALAAPDGGGGYWHPHPGDDPLRMLVEEFVPLLAGRGLRVDRLAVVGWSMGGYGALVCGVTYRDRFASIAAISPAVFRSYADATRVNRESFGSAEEWARYDVTGRAAEFAGLPVRVAIGTGDPFQKAVRTLRDRLPDPGVVDISTGCHDGRYWESIAPAQVRAIGAALAGSPGA
jgi:enterochelin esterase-like enzyme